MPVYIQFYKKAQEISGRFNNCALNVALPSILNGIKLLALYEQNLLLEEDVLAFEYVGRYYKEYELLKKIFLDYYQIPEQKVPDWSSFFAAIEHFAPGNFAAKETLFTPVNRLFIYHKLDPTLEILDEVTDALNIIENFAALDSNRQSETFNDFQKALEAFYMINNEDFSDADKASLQATHMELTDLKNNERQGIQTFGKYELLDLRVAEVLFYNYFGIQYYCKTMVSDTESVVLRSIFRIEDTPSKFIVLSHFKNQHFYAVGEIESNKDDQVLNASFQKISQAPLRAMQLPNGHQKQFVEKEFQDFREYVYKELSDISTEQLYELASQYLKDHHILTKEPIKNNKRIANTNHVGRNFQPFNFELNANYNINSINNSLAFVGHMIGIGIIVTACLICPPIGIIVVGSWLTAMLISGFLFTLGISMSVAGILNRTESTKSNESNIATSSEQYIQGEYKACNEETDSSKTTTNGESKTLKIDNIDEVSDIEAEEDSKLLHSMRM